MVSAVAGTAAVPAATYKIRGRERAFAEEGNEGLHWLEQDATRMVYFVVIFATLLQFFCELNSVPQTAHVHTVLMAIFLADMI